MKIKRRSIWWSGVAILVGLPAHALGADEGHAQQDVMGWDTFQFVMALVTFGVAFFILSKLAWPKILGGLEEREEKIRGEIKAAEEAREQAQKAQEDYARELETARAEAQQMIEHTKAEQIRLAADLRSKAEVEMSQMREGAMRSIGAAKRAALDEIYSEMATLSISIASKILDREVNEDDQRRIVEDTVEKHANSQRLTAGV